MSFIHINCILLPEKRCIRTLFHCPTTSASVKQLDRKQKLALLCKALEGQVSPAHTCYSWRENNIAQRNAERPDDDIHCMNDFTMMLRAEPIDRTTQGKPQDLALSHGKLSIRKYTSSNSDSTALPAIKQAPSGSTDTLTKTR